MDDDFNLLSPLIDFDEGTRLCGGDPMLYASLLSLFPLDPSMESIKTSIDIGDLQGAFLHAHTLKGIAAQLALRALYEKSSHLCDLLHDEQPSFAYAVKDSMQKLLGIYQDTLREIDVLTRRLL